MHFLAKFTNNSDQKSELECEQPLTLHPENHENSVDAGDTHIFVDDGMQQILNF